MSETVVISTNNVCMPIDIDGVNLDLDRVQEDHWSEDGEHVSQKDLAMWHLEAKKSLIETLIRPDVVVKYIETGEDNNKALTLQIIVVDPDEIITY